MPEVNESLISSLNQFLEQYLEKLQHAVIPAISEKDLTRLIDNSEKLLNICSEIKSKNSTSSTLSKDLTDLLEKTPYAITIVRNSVFYYMNQEFLKLFGYNDSGELIGQTVLSVIAPEDWDRIKPLSEKSITGIPVIDDYEIIALKKDGTRFEANIRVNKVTVQLDEAFIYVISDITEEKRIQETLRNNEKKYRLLAENSKDVIWILGLDGRFQYVSPSVFELRGYTSEEVLEQTLEEAVVPESLEVIKERMIILDYYFKTNKKFLDTPVDEIEQFRKDGSKVWTEVVTKVIYDNENKPVSILGVSRNIEERKKAEMELLKYAENLRILNSTKDKFFSIIAHDLKNPFNALLGLSEYLIEDFEALSDSDKKNIIDEMHKVSKRSYNLLENLLTWSRCQTGNLQPDKARFDLNTSILNSLYLLSGLCKNKNIQIEKSIDETIEVFADKEMINSVIRNLLTNAIKFTHPGGMIKIECHSEGSTAVTSITDNGIGIDEEMLPLLFSVDVPVSQKGTSNETGSGLGLILCKEFVERNGGKIWVTSKLKQGSTFCFSLEKIVNK